MFDHSNEASFRDLLICERKLDQRGSNKIKICSFVISIFPKFLGPPTLPLNIDPQKIKFDFKNATNGSRYTFWEKSPNMDDIVPSGFELEKKEVDRDRKGPPPVQVGLKE